MIKQLQQHKLCAYRISRGYTSSLSYYLIKIKSNSEQIKYIDQFVHTEWNSVVKQLPCEM